MAARYVTGAACALAGVAPVLALLAWGYRLGPFAAWFWILGVPSLALLAAAGLVLARTGYLPGLHAGLVAGCVGGVIGTAAYDAIRVPELALGLRPFAPIQSYGLLILDARASSGLTDLAGWAYNMANGVGFGVAYGALAFGRRWYWAIPWAMGLETASIVTPLGDIYAIRGQPVQITFAYLGHVAYAIPLGLLVQDAGRFTGWLGNEVGRAALPGLLALVAAVEVAWHPPWSDPAPAGPTISSARMAPAWIRLPAGACTGFANPDSIAHRLSGADAPGLLPPGGGPICFSRPGVLRVRVDDRPFSGGYVISDPEMPR